MGALQGGPDDTLQVQAQGGVGIGGFRFFIFQVSGFAVVGGQDQQAEIHPVGCRGQGVPVQHAGQLCGFQHRCGEVGRKQDDAIV